MVVGFLLLLASIRVEESTPVCGGADELSESLCLLESHLLVLARATGLPCLVGLTFQRQILRQKNSVISRDWYRRQDRY
jgi:hypothetical protein